ncbi:MAG: DUF1361 domain-containing protein [Candidatus Pacebacteria bacterium]|nr:DUF1361 domain-containing protein [Candidatus Paceibacterota bacterium]
MYRKPVVSFIVSLSVFALALSLLRLFLSEETSYLWLNWNLFLALLPLLFAWLAIHFSRQFLLNKVFLFLWLFFLPNAPYLITDLIHLNTVAPRSLVWYDGVMIFSYALVGVFVWLTSTLLLEQHFHWKKWVIWLIALLTGCGIYLGRNLRFNSWDIFYRPHHIFQETLSFFEGPFIDSIFFMSLIFATFLLVCYFAMQKIFKDK